VTHYFERRVAGFLMHKELSVLGGLLHDPGRPYVALLGGAKIAGKIDLIKNLLTHVDRIMVGGGMAFTFLKAAGLETGNSLVNDDFLEMCRELMQQDGAGDQKRIFLPVDCVVAREIDELSDYKTVSTGNIPEGWTGVDIGEKTVELFNGELEKAKTVFWNGPMGVFEIDNFAEGTRKIAKKMAGITSGGVKTVVGGGDSVSALNQAGLAKAISHISTGGGASLALLEGSTLPAVEALEKKGK
jgi:phosphoglycerate kinase